MRGFHFDSDGAAGGGLEIKRKQVKKREQSPGDSPTPRNFAAGPSEKWSYLVGKQHQDCVASSTLRGILDREGVIIIPNNVKIDVSLSGAHHTRGTLDANAHITFKKRQVSTCERHVGALLKPSPTIVTQIPNPESGPTYMPT